MKKTFVKQTICSVRSCRRRRSGLHGSVGEEPPRVKKSCTGEETRPVTPGAIRAASQRIFNLNPLTAQSRPSSLTSLLIPISAFVPLH